MNFNFSYSKPYLNQKVSYKVFVDILRPKSLSATNATSSSDRTASPPAAVAVRSGHSAAVTKSTTCEVGITQLYATSLIGLSCNEISTQ